jgi:hypothetical protein
MGNSQPSWLPRIPQPQLCFACHQLYDTICVIVPILALAVLIKQKEILVICVKWNMLSKNCIDFQANIFWVVE